MTGVLSTLFPEESFNLFGIGQDIANEQERINDANVNSINKSNETDETLEERIKLGKSKVQLYEPITEDEKRGFDSLGGMDDLKKKLRQDIIEPLKDPIRAEYNEKHFGIEMPKGILLYGPPGCGKTTIVERLSVEAGLPLLKMQKDTFGSCFVDGTEQNIGAVFEYAKSIATKEKPVLLFIDEMDATIGTRDAWDSHQNRESQIGVFLPKIQDAFKNNIIVIGAANHYEKIDQGIRGRLRQQFYIPLPDEKTRYSILKMKLTALDHGIKLAKNENAMQELIRLTEQFDIRALEDIVDASKKEAFYDKNGIRDITLDDMKKAIKDNIDKRSKEKDFQPSSRRKSAGFNTNA